MINNFGLAAFWFLLTSVVVRGDGAQLVLDLGADVESVDELVDELLRHRLVGSCELLERLVWVRISLTAEYGLDSFSHNRPCVVEVVVELLLVEDELAEPLQCAFERDDAMSDGHSDISEYGRVGEVALEPAYRQLCCEELKYGVSYAEVALAILVVDGVDLMRHCA